MKLKENLLSLLVRWLGFGLRARLPQVTPSPAISLDMSPDGNAILPKVSLLALGKMAAEPGQSFNALPQLPLGVIPQQLLAQDGHTHTSLAMAQDNAAFCHAFLNGAVQGTGFKGYAALAELSQLSEYRSPTETLATEMTRQWISFKSTGAENRSEQLQAIEAAFDQFKIRDKLKQAVEHDGFFGRGMLYIDMGMPELNDTPLIINKATIRQGSVQGFKVIEPVWTSPANYNAIDPTAKDFYQPHSWYVMGRQIHTSRLITLIARPLPDMLKPAYNFSGLSMTQLLEPAVNAWLRTRDSVSELVHSFSTSGVKTDMQAVLSGGNGDDILHRAQLFNQMRDNRGLMLLDKDNEEFFQFHTPLGGMEALQAQAQEQMAAPCHIPLVKLFGITPHGLNASSEGEIKVFYDYIQAMQQTLLTDPLVKILQIIQLHLFGEIYDDITFEYCPLEQMNEQQEVSISKAKVEIGTALLEAGVISKEEERQRLAADPLSGYDGLGDGLSSELPEQEQAGQSEQSLFNPAQDGQVKNPEFEAKHDREEDGKFAPKGQGVPTKGKQPAVTAQKNQGKNPMPNALGHKAGTVLPAEAGAKPVVKAASTTPSKVSAKINTATTAVNKSAKPLAGNETHPQFKVNLKENGGSAYGQFLFAVRHPATALEIGSVAKNPEYEMQPNISTIVSTFQLNFINPEELKALGYSDDQIKTEGSMGNAYRHTLWQAIIKRNFGHDIAVKVGDAHESGERVDLSKTTGLTLAKADEVADLLNNQIGRWLSSRSTNSELAKKVLDMYNTQGLYLAIKDADGTYSVQQKTMPKAVSKLAYSKVSLLDHTGAGSKLQKARKDFQKRIVNSEKYAKFK
jgi:phage-related protein (TIGR01555 family)